MDVATFVVETSDDQSSSGMVLEQMQGCFATLSQISSDYSINEIDGKASNNLMQAIMYLETAIQNVQKNLKKGNPPF